MYKPILILLAMLPCAACITPDVEFGHVRAESISIGHSGGEPALLAGVSGDMPYIIMYNTDGEIALYLSYTPEYGPRLGLLGQDGSVQRVIRISDWSPPGTKEDGAKELQSLWERIKSGTLVDSLHALEGL